MSPHPLHLSSVQVDDGAPVRDLLHTLSNAATRDAIPSSVTTSDLDEILQLVDVVGHGTAGLTEEEVLTAVLVGAERVHHFVTDEDATVLGLILAIAAAMAAPLIGAVLPRGFCPQGSDRMRRGCRTPPLRQPRAISHPTG